MKGSSSRAHLLSVLARRIDETQAKLDDRVREVERLDMLVAELRAEFNELRAKFNEITNLDTPIASLPTEMLAAIFNVGYSLPRRRRKKRYQPFELSVSSVSRRWRDVAISTKSLWTRIQFLPHQPLDLVKAYFSRSGIRLLDIRADLRLHRRSSLSTDLFLEAIRPHIDRCRTMRLQSNHRRFLYAVFKRIHFGSALKLETLEMSVIADGEEADEDAGEGEDEDEDEGEGEVEGEGKGEGDDESDNDEGTEENNYTNIERRDEDKETGNVTGSAPSLKILRLKNILLHRHIPPSSALTILHIHGVEETCSKFQDILDNLSSLTRLVIYGYVISEDDFPTRLSVLPRLSSLHLLPSDSEDSQVTLLQIIGAPMLKHLEFQDPFIEDRLFQGPEWTAGSPRYPCLYSLTISLLICRSVRTWSVLQRAFPTIVVLALSNVNFAEAHTLAGPVGLNTELVPSPSVPWWPHLQTLSLDFLGGDGLEPLHKLLSSRVAQGCPLRKLSFNRINLSPEACRDVFKDIIVELEEPVMKPAARYNGWYHDDD
jgi:hypothetical protein